MKEYIMDFSLDNCALGNQGYNRILLQLFGYQGHGKSSFINSCKYVIDDSEYREFANVAKGENESETRKRSSYKLTENVTLVDNRGAGKMSKMETGEIYLQLGNFLPLDKEVEWQTNFGDMVNKVLRSEGQEVAADFIVPIFVYSGKTGMGKDADLSEIISSAREITGIDPAVVITHELCISADKLKQLGDRFREKGARNIYPVENYTEKDKLKTRGKHTAILKCLYESLMDVEFRMNNKLDPIQERIQRKEFLISYAHNRALEKQKEKYEHERFLEKKAMERALEEERERTRQEKARNKPWYQLW
ncbi:uncharacterized protein LOC121398201 [Xenopus laevis]|nr:uncharacterized protein LOC121398201 [Xenopus laevis]